jgi:hypothetical protein
LTFSAWPAGTISWYSTGESPPIKAERAEARLHLATTCGENNTIRRKKEIFSEVWEKSAAVDSAEPNSKDFLAPTPRFCQRQFFVSAKILLMQVFCRCQYFVNTSILLTPRFCRHEHFVDTNILSTPMIYQHRVLPAPIILYMRVFCRRQ